MVRWMDGWTSGRKTTFASGYLLTVSLLLTTTPYILRWRAAGECLCFLSLFSHFHLTCQGAKGSGGRRAKLRSGRQGLVLHGGGVGSNSISQKQASNVEELLRMGRKWKKGAPAAPAAFTSRVYRELVSFFGAGG